MLIYVFAVAVLAAHFYYMWWTETRIGRLRKLVQNANSLLEEGNMVRDEWKGLCDRALVELGFSNAEVARLRGLLRAHGIDDREDAGC